MSTRRSRSRGASGPARRRPDGSADRARQRPALAEIEVLPGLEPIALDEVRSVVRGIDVRPVGEGRLRVAGITDPDRLHRLRTIVSVGLVESFAVARPKALLGDADLRRMVASVRRATDGRRFTGLRIAAAGAATPVMQRIGTELATALGVPPDPDDGDLVVRVVPGAGGGWEVITRTTPRPLATRPWRVADMPGSLNGSIAAAMVRLARPARGGVAVNLMGGAATLAVEHALADATAHAAVVEIDERALAAAARNVDAAGVSARVALLRADATAAGLAPGRTRVLYCDLPYGDKVGTQAANDALYPAVLAEAARLAHRDARFVVITHDVRRFTRHLAATPAWRVERDLRVFQSGHRPGIWVLRPT